MKYSIVRRNPLAGLTRISTSQMRAIEETSSAFRAFNAQPKQVPFPSSWTDADFECETAMTCPKCNGELYTDIVPLEGSDKARALAERGHPTPVQGTSPGVYLVVQCTLCNGVGRVPVSKGSDFRMKAITADH